MHSLHFDLLQFYSIFRFSYFLVAMGKIFRKIFKCKKFSCPISLIILNFAFWYRQLGYTFNIKGKGEKVFKYYIDVLCLGNCSQGTDYR